MAVVCQRLCVPLCLHVDLWLSKASLTRICSSPFVVMFKGNIFAQPLAGKLSGHSHKRAGQRARSALGRWKLSWLEEWEHPWCVCSITRFVLEMFLEGTRELAVLELSLAACSFAKTAAAWHQVVCSSRQPCHQELSAGLPLDGPGWSPRPLVAQASVLSSLQKSHNS